MKTTLLGAFLLFSSLVMSQSKGKILPIDKSVLNLIDDTTEKVYRTKFSVDFDYVILVNKNSNKKDTILVDKNLYVSKKRKFKN